MSTFHEHTKLLCEVAVHGTGDLERPRVLYQHGRWLTAHRPPLSAPDLTSVSLVPPQSGV
ncbi:hypothetical protein K488DRAFT_90972 [Vararia minispora EC-137]|uniref:Uncharacterized protein n=1 Tax=Vararia minispora EC-137 TaxID=1314806 RepID=A0ACB8Q6M4_9AGAM|nr:hypothetical protein K488DRAFT_90972 [Vararia minispora EC-137]